MGDRELPVWIAGSALAGAGLVTLGMFLRNRHRRRRDERRRCVNLYVRWLAARMTLTRSSHALVSAFRALAREPVESPLFELRSSEAQRARSEWFECMRELDGIEAQFIGAWVSEGSEEELPQRVGADALRVAVEGEHAALETLARALRDADAGALALVRERLTRPSSPGAWHPVVWMVRLHADLRRIAETWARPL